ncbi:putative reverse transcriptase domain-containing protein [Tanacetum coccineum]
MTDEAVNELIARRVAEALEARDAARNLKPLDEGGDEQRGKNGDDYEGGNRGGDGNSNINGVNGNRNGGGNDNENGNGNGNENGNGNGGGNGYENHNVNFRGLMSVAREYTFQDFPECQPLNFKGAEGVVGLTRWFEKMENGNGPESGETKLRDSLSEYLTYPGEWLHHEGPCTVRCRNYKRVGHVARDCMADVALNTQRALVRNQFGILIFMIVERPGHYIKDCPKLRNQNHGNKTGNKTGNNKATTKAYAIEGRRANPDSNVVTGTFLLNKCYASILFDSGADRSFVSSTFSALLDIAPSTLDTSYVVELIDRRISETNYHAMIICDEKIIRIPYGDEVLIIQGDDCDSETQVTSKKTKDRSNEKRLEDVPILREFLEVFPEDLHGLPPARQVEFQIDLVPGAAPMA